MANRWQNQGGHPTSQTPPGRLSVKGKTRSQKRKPAKAPPGVQTPVKKALEAQNAPPPRPRMLPVKVIQAFYQNLPDESLQQLAHASELRYSNTSMVSDGQVALTTLTVPNLTVYVFTDVEFYATAPGPGMGAAPVQLNPYTLTGSIVFRFEFNNRPPMYMRHNAVGPYVPATSAINSNGWGFLDTKFGAERSTGFAVYARGGEIVSLYAVATAIDQLPQFPITKFGVKLNGFSVNENAFDSTWLSSGNVSA